MKPDNILVHEERGGIHHVKLCDFDSAREIGESFPSAVDDVSGVNVLKFTRLWVCPEVYHFNNKVTSQTQFVDSSSSPSSILPVRPEMDIFSVGLVLICLLSPENERSVSMTVLPENEVELLNSLTNPSYLANKVSCLAVEYHDSLLSLCCLDDTCRGSLFEVLRIFQRFGLTGLRTELLIQNRVNQNHIEVIETMVKKVDHLVDKSENLPDKADLGNVAGYVVSEFLRAREEEK